MFICTPCRREKTRNGPALSHSYGQCESCKQVTTCENLPTEFISWADPRPVFAPQAVTNTDPASVVRALRSSVSGDAWSHLNSDTGRGQTVLVEQDGSPVAWDAPAFPGTRLLTTPFGTLPYLADQAERLPDLINAAWCEPVTTASGALVFQPRGPAGHPSGTTQWLETLDGTLIALSNVKAITTERSSMSSDETTLNDLYAVTLAGHRALLCTVTAEHTAPLRQAIGLSDKRLIQPVELIEELP